MEDNSNRRKAAMERAAEALKVTCSSLLVALYGDLRDDTIWKITRVVCKEARDACEEAREFSETLANDGVKFWKEWEWCCVLRDGMLSRRTAEAVELLDGEVDVLWNLCEDLRWGALRELKMAACPENGKEPAG